MNARAHRLVRLIRESGDSAAVGLLGAACVLIAAGGALTQWFYSPPLHAQDRGPELAASDAQNGTCATCHRGIEDMHPYAPVTCVQCHGGDAEAAEKDKAHVSRAGMLPGDERVLGQTFSPEYLRFLDPGNLRAAAMSCGPCHPKAVYDVKHSLHASTAGHLGDGLYENGVVSERGPQYSVFKLIDDKSEEDERPEGAVTSLKQIPGFSFGGAPNRISTHFTDLPRKACMVCHLWSRGRAVRGRAGMDGDYRGEGCSACHVPYADDGLSSSRDPTVNRFEPGHPREHRMVRFPSTTECTRCHYGDASIGLSFRGLAQPVPGMPQSPDAPGLHRKRLNGVYYIDDPAATPADLHHQAGMDCVDCHTRDDTMGDGFIYKRMEDAVETTCQMCHGTPTEFGSGVTRKGTKLAHFVVRGDGRYIKSRGTGKLHRVKQARDVVQPGNPDYNAKAALAMTSDHGRLECYACHSGWNPNFFGFHFDRNEAFTQLDLLSGRRTTGRVTTQEKVFSTFKHFYLGWNSHGRIAPYMVGFSTMATVHDEDGELILDQELPVTKAGLSGMTMIHHQTHTTTARARDCVECHRAPSTFGRGSVNFKLTRDFAVTAGKTGVRTISIDRKNPANSALLASAAVEEGRAVGILRSRLTGHIQYVFVASPTEGLVVVKMEMPGFPDIVERVPDVALDPQRMLVADTHLYLADGEGGLRVFAIDRPSRPRQVAHLPDIKAYDVFLDGFTLYVAAGPKGLAIVDVRDPEDPVVRISSFDVNGADTARMATRRVEVLFQYTRPNPETLEGSRLPARAIAAIGDAQSSLWLVDVTEPRDPYTIRRVTTLPVRDLAMGTIYELGSDGGAIPSRERDFVFLLSTGNALTAVDITNPDAPEIRSDLAISGDSRALRVARIYNPPFLQTVVITGGEAGVQLIDVSRPAKMAVLATIPGRAIYDIDLEEFPLDRTVDADGEPIMDVSHEGARWLNKREFNRVLSLPLDIDEGPK